MVREAGPQDLALEHGGEGLAIEQAGEHVELRHDIRVAQVERPRDRRAGALDELVQTVDVLLAEPPVAVAGQHAEQALRAVLVEQRHDETGAHRLFAIWCNEVPREAHLDRPRAAVVGEAHPGNVVGLGLREPDGGDDRRALGP